MTADDKTWQMTATDEARKKLDKLPPHTALHLLDRFEEKVLKQNDPTVFAKQLKHGMIGLWRLRVEDYRLVFRIIPDTRTIQITTIGHRKDVYR